MSGLTIHANEIQIGRFQENWNKITFFIPADKINQIDLSSYNQEAEGIVTQEQATNAQYLQFMGASLAIYVVAIPIVLALSQSVFIPLIFLSLGEGATLVGGFYSWINDLEALERQYAAKINETVNFVNASISE